MDEKLLHLVVDDVCSRGVPALSPLLNVVLLGPAERGHRLPHPVTEVDRIGEVGDEHARGGPRPVLMAVGAVLIGDAEVIRCTPWIASSNARAVFGQRLAALEVALGDLFERRARAKLNEDASFAVPPPKARYLGVVTVEDASLGKGGRRWKAASIAMQLVALGVYQAPQERHLPAVQCSTQRVGADAIDGQDHHLALHVAAPRTRGGGRRRAR